MGADLETPQTIISSTITVSTPKTIQTTRRLSTRVGRASALITHSEVTVTTIQRTEAVAEVAWSLLFLPTESNQSLQESGNAASALLPLLLPKTTTTNYASTFSNIWSPSPNLRPVRIAARTLATTHACPTISSVRTGNWKNSCALSPIASGHSGPKRRSGDIRLAIAHSETFGELLTINSLAFFIFFNVVPSHPPI